MDTTDTSLLELSRNPLMQAMRRVIQVLPNLTWLRKASRMSPDLAAIGRIMDLTQDNLSLHPFRGDVFTIRKWPQGPLRICRMSVYRLWQWLKNSKSCWSVS